MVKRKEYIDSDSGSEESFGSEDELSRLEMEALDEWAGDEKSDEVEVEVEVVEASVGKLVVSFKFSDVERYGSVVEGGEIEEVDEEIEEESEVDSDSSIEETVGGTLSERQRAIRAGVNREGSSDTLSLPMGKSGQGLGLGVGQTQRVMSAEEVEFRKADAARKRKQFVLKKLEAEKRETLKKLLDRKVDKKSVKDERELRVQERVLVKHRALNSWLSNSSGCYYSVGG